MSYQYDAFHAMEEALREARAAIRNMNAWAYLAPEDQGGLVTITNPAYNKLAKANDQVAEVLGRIDEMRGCRALRYFDTVEAKE